MHFGNKEKKEEILLSPKTKKLPTPTEKSKKHSDNTKNATKNFDKCPFLCKNFPT